MSNPANPAMDYALPEGGGGGGGGGILFFASAPALWATRLECTLYDNKIVKMKISRYNFKFALNSFAETTTIQIIFFCFS